MWNLSSPTIDRTCTPGIGRRSINYWNAREVPFSGDFNEQPGSSIAVAGNDGISKHGL